MNFFGELIIEKLDPDGDFLVLKAISTTNADGEIFIDKTTLRFLSNYSKSAVLLSSVKYIEFSKYGTFPESELVTICMNSDKHEAGDRPLDIGFINIKDSQTVRAYFEDINLKINRS